MQTGTLTQESLSSYTVATGKSFGAGVSGISATKQEGNANANAGSGNQNSNAGSGNGNNANSNSVNSNAGNANAGNQNSNAGAGNANSGNANNANSNLANANNATTKLSASSVTAQLGTNSQFALDKAYSVLGSGNVKVGNQTLESLTEQAKANGDNSLNSLKRNVGESSLTLANVSTGTSVSAALDTRLLSKEGWQSIERDYQDSTTIVEAFIQIATTERASLKDFFKENEKAYLTLNGVREKVANDPELKALLASDKLSETQKHQIVQSITNQVMSELGYMPADSTTIFTDEKGQGGADIKGFYSTETKKSYINVKNIADIKELVTTTGVESQRAMDDASGMSALELQSKDNSRYASNFGNSVGRYYGYALNSYDLDYGNAKVKDVKPVNQNYYTQSNTEFAELNKEKGANNPAVACAITGPAVAACVGGVIATTAAIAGVVYVADKINDAINERKFASADAKDSQAKSNKKEEAQAQNLGAVVASLMPPEGDDEDEDKKKDEKNSENKVEKNNEHKTILDKTLKGDNARIVKNEQELDSLWKEISKDSKLVKETTANDGTKIILRETKDGMIIKYRQTSRSGGKTIEYKMPNSKNFNKIHIKGGVN